MALMAPMVNMKKLLDASQVAIITNTEAKAAETQAHVTAKAADTKNSLLVDNAANFADVNGNTAALDIKLDSITTVNGNISTEVQAINSNTNTKIAEIKADIAAKGVVKSVQRGELLFTSVAKSQTVIITAVDLAKTVVNITQRYSEEVGGSNRYTRPTAQAAVRLSDATTLTFQKAATYVVNTVSWEVIEYE